jgi:hypothetical protein
VVIHPDFKHDTTSLISILPIEGLLRGRKFFLIFKSQPFLSIQYPQ